MEIGSTIDETGLLTRERCGFYLDRDAGGRFALELPRMPVDEIEKRVRLIGLYAGDGRVEVEGVARI